MISCCDTFRCKYFDSLREGIFGLPMEKPRTNQHISPVDFRIWEWGCVVYTTTQEDEDARVASIRLLVEFFVVINGFTLDGEIRTKFMLRNVYQKVNAVVFSCS